jgi:hypothetical protein
MIVISRLLPLATLLLITFAPARAQSEPQADESVLLAQNGEPKAVIVLPDAGRSNAEKAIEYMNYLAASQLHEFLGRMTGSDFKIVRNSALGDVQVNGDNMASAKVPATSYILVGESELTKRLNITPELTPGEMYIKAAGNVLALMGPTDGTPYTGGTFYAAHHVLESLGVNYLWPGELGLVVPRHADIAIPDGTQSFTPTIKQRSMRMILGGSRALEGAKDLGIENDYVKKVAASAKLDANYTVRSLGGWLEWQNVAGDIGIRGGHSLGDLWDRFGKTHPDWFALQPNGTRIQHSSERARLCLSNSELVQQVAADIIAKADANPNLLSIPLSLNDGGVDAFCMCKVNALGEPGCVTYDSPEGRKIHLWGWDKDYVSLTDRYMVFCNRVAEIVEKKYPKLLMVVDAYSLYSAPPVKTKLNPNLVVRYVPSTMDDWGAWSEKASKIYWRPNSLSAPWRTGELKFNRNFGEDLNYAAHHSTIATDFDSILENWATEGLNYYVLARMNWNPDADINQLIDEYCQSGFGPAASEVRAYFDKVEKLTDVKDKDMYERNDSDPPRAIVHVRVDTLAEYFTPQVISELRGLLDAAARKTSGETNQKIRERIAFLRIGLDWTDMQARAYRTLIAFKKGEHVDLPAAAKLLDARRAMMRQIFNEQPLAVNVAYIDYADRGYWQPLQKAIENAGIKAPATAQGNTAVDADENGQPSVVPKTK